MIQFNWEITLGTIVSTVATILTMLGIAWKLGLRFRAVERKTNLMFGWFIKKFTAEGIDSEDIIKFFDEDQKKK